MTDSPLNHATYLRDQGIKALRAGQRGQAQEFLAQAVELNPHDEQAWLWLSGAADTDEDQRFCLERVIQINPANAAAQQGLAQLKPALGPSAPPAGPVPGSATAPHQPATPPEQAEAGPMAPIFATSSEFTFPKLAQWKSVWYGAVVVGAGGLMMLGRALRAPFFSTIGILVLIIGGLVYLFLFVRGFVKPSKAGYLSYDSAKPLSKNQRLMGERTNPQALKAGQQMEISYSARFSGNVPLLRLVRQDRMGHDLEVAWELPFKSEDQVRALMQIPSDSMYVVELMPRGVHGAVELHWTFV